MKRTSQVYNKSDIEFREIYNSLYSNPLIYTALFDAQFRKPHRSQRLTCMLFDDTWPLLARFYQMSTMP